MTTPTETPATTTTRTMLAIEGLTVGYAGAPVIDGMRLDVPHGAVVALLGANGAGKTTLLRTVSGLVRPRSGRISLDGQDLSGLSVEDRVRRGLAQVPEGRSVVSELTVEENLHLGALWKIPGRSARRAAVAEVYEAFEPLARRRRSMGHQLSGGERQMLALARALVARPRVLLLDEPSLGLAPRVVAQLFAILRDTAERTGLTVLLAEQNVTSALSIADRGVVLGLGEIVADAPAAEIAADPALRHAYLGF
ncbi:branched-chain amino acid transport system ATP-binding protein [Isoptericola sp. CG 20/1183]|uniref:Branched-chain amino acid transport system ATP-binding protein n=1 Tax=Isoptericola halotolerans TaxID=300560 RepID=A0ABX5E9H4_9MICO|nr:MULTISPECIES: ABC transporter ATP-binding protein [Isoptericola]PRZ02761.1 branched-chain amino acid transport system ATP-binding protein [Isoptericola sp. CG 20/1183]PRZ03159.1 branched-chain amino acid transport system ATP-binding protein [Isoptericola halotolerans]